MEASAACYNLLRSYEGLSLVPYQDSASVWTVGIGHRLYSDEALLPVTLAEAERLLHYDVNRASLNVLRLTAGIRLSQGQFDALVAFVFNVGRDAFAQSTMLQRILARDYLGAAAEFSRWSHVHQAGKVVELTGLVRRRAAEKALFLSPSMPRAV